MALAPFPLPVTVAEEAILRNALGLRYASTPCRDHFLAPAWGLTRDCCERLAFMGLMTHGRALEGGRRFFYVTAPGAALVGHELPKD